jgi:hypothetical protein
MNDLYFLYNKYYGGKSSFSLSTSSHWKIYGRNQVEFNSDGQRSLIGNGFGDFQPISFFNLLLNTPVFVYLAIKYWIKLGFKLFVEACKLSLKTNQIFSYDFTRMVLTLKFLNSKILNMSRFTIVVIGDGYGRLGSLIKQVFPESQIIFINLGRQLVFDFYYSEKAFPNYKHKLINTNSEFIEDFNYIEAENFQNLNIKGDLFINIASMQEMDTQEIKKYFKLVLSQQSGTLFYCCNRISKRLPNGLRINFFEYPWTKELIIEVDELCPWYKRFPKSRPPFIQKFDGPIQHRLVRLQ